MKIVLLKLISGDEILCHVENDIAEDAKMVTLTKVRKVTSVPVSPQQTIQMITPFWGGAQREDDVEIRVAHILAGTTPAPDLESAYRESVSGIAIARR
jgi:hypothetical protein